MCLEFRNRIPVGPRATGNEPLQLFDWNPAHGAVDFVRFPIALIISRCLFMRTISTINPTRWIEAPQYQ